MFQAIISLLLIGEPSPNVGTTGFNFLKIAPTARAAAMGNAAIGFGDDAFGLWYNPAGIVERQGQQLGLGYIAYPAGVQHGAVSFVNPMKEKALAFGGYYLNSGAMKRTDESGTEAGTFMASYLNVAAAGAWKASPKLGLGAELKAVYGTIDAYWTVAAAADIAASYVLGPNLRGSVVARNLGVTAKAFQADSTGDKLPMDFAVGIGYEANPRFRLAAEAHQPIDNKLELRVGAEGWVTNDFCLRAGYTTAGGDLKSGGGLDLFAGASTGMGIRVKNLVIDYSYTPMIILGNAHRISICYNPK